ncbi:MAG TPA: carboxypeptidase-like regulatory domain-containing protein [Planctomycetota bacterium]|nr:carboxypeptidase-like regulatory domain-containing protein [Planctomycetota bacterium]
MRRGLVLVGVLALVIASFARRETARTDARAAEVAVRAGAPGSTPIALEATEPTPSDRTEVSAPVEVAPDLPRLEVLVTFADAPLAGASVALFPFGESQGFLTADDASARIVEERTGPDGIAHLGDRVAATYLVLATAPGGEQARARIVVAPAARVRTTLALGTAALEGTVHDLDGRPFAGARVLARQGDVWFVTAADASGWYRLGGLTGGSARSVRALALDLAAGETLPFELASGETRRVDFGSPNGRARWSGVVRLPSGAPLAGPFRLYFTGSPEAAIGNTPVDAAGHFDVVLPPGRYVARFETPAGLALGSADLAGALVQDLAVPRVVVRGRLRYVGTKHPLAKGPEHDVALALAKSDGTPVTGTLLRSDARFAFLGLEPGSYALTTSPWTIAATADGTQPFEIGAGTDELELDLAITDP